MKSWWRMIAPAMTGGMMYAGEGWRVRVWPRERV
jgi:hypothetical protein